MNLREWALPVYTILIQLAAGSLLLLWVIRLWPPHNRGLETDETLTRIAVGIVSATILIAMVGAHFHLSKPWLSFTAVINFRSSWLSREIVFTVIFFLLSGFLWASFFFNFTPGRLENIIAWSAILAGYATIYCMANIYLLPTQIAWNVWTTEAFYFSETILLGAIALAIIFMMTILFSKDLAPDRYQVQLRYFQNALAKLSVFLAFGVVLVIAISVSQFKILSQSEAASAQTSLRLLFGLYRPLFFMRFWALFLGVVFFFYSVFRIRQNTELIATHFSLVCVAGVMIMVAEVLERFLFYATHVRVGL